MLNRLLVSRLVSAISLVLLTCPALVADDIAVTLRHQTETSENSKRFHTQTRDEIWKPNETAIIVCDVWDSHNCFNAVQRVKQIAPRIDRVLKNLRDQGVTVIHAPSGCMDFYKDHPARKRAMGLSISKNLPEKITEWCYQIPAEERGVYPIDQEKGGNDDTPEEHAAWEKVLVKEGRREHKWPWQRQIDVIHVDEEKDYISDRGDEIWSLLESSSINNVIITGVHTNMCVLGRPFGLRQLSQNGKNVVLMRDLTDTMYNPASKPFVSHFSGTDLIISHIEKFVCPTITSDQILGDKEFRFKKDKRKHLVIVMAEDEYRTNETLPAFAVDPLNKEFRVSLVFGSDKERNDIPGLEVLKDADALLVSIRRRVLPAGQMKAIRDLVKAGKPVIGIRTASHAFSLRDKPAPDGFVDWTSFDADVFGGNYHNHYGNKLTTTIQFPEAQHQHPILKGVDTKPFVSGGSLYKTSPLKDGTTVVVTGSVEGEKPEPVAWTFKRADGGRSFYSAIGNINDFEQPATRQTLLNGIRWAIGD